MSRPGFSNWQTRAASVSRRRSPGRLRRSWPLASSLWEQKVKNIAEPVQAFRVILVGQAPRQPARSSPPRWVWAAAIVPVLILVLAGTVWQFWPTVTVSGKPSVAVLPFDNYGGDEATGRLADGLIEDIITDLAGFPEFQVIARNSTEQYRDKPAAPSEVGKALGAGFVVEGSIQRHPRGRS